MGARAGLYIGRTVLQTVGQKLHVLINLLILYHHLLKIRLQK